MLQNDFLNNLPNDLNCLTISCGELKNININNLPPSLIQLNFSYKTIMSKVCHILDINNIPFGCRIFFVRFQNKYIIHDIYTEEFEVIMENGAISLMDIK